MFAHQDLLPEFGISLTNAKSFADRELIPYCGSQPWLLFGLHHRYKPED